jgi:hypothetical protein
MDIGPGLAPGTTASGLMTKSLVPGGSRPGTDMAPRGCFRRLGGLPHRSRARGMPGTNKLHVAASGRLGGPHRSRARGMPGTNES